MSGGGYRRGRQEIIYSRIAFDFCLLFIYIPSYSYEHNLILAMETKSYIAYYRVSTARQGTSGLGLDAQRESVANYLKQHGGNLIREFKEIESGKKNHRPKLEEALALAKSEKAVLIIAKMDRLGRRASYVLNLLDNSNVDFVFTEMPHASDLEIGIRAVVAQEESRVISERTKAAMAAAKARGVKLGTYGATLAQRNKNAAYTQARGLAKLIGQLRAQRIETVREIRDELNARGIPTARSGKWHLQTVHNLLKRIDRLGLGGMG